MSTKTKSHFFSRLILGTAAIGSVLVLGIGFFLIGLLGELNEPIQEIQNLKSTPMLLASEIFDRNGEKIGEIAAERRYFVSSKDIPQWVIHAFLCAEDKTFYKHSGVNFKAIARALVKNIGKKRMSQGASTITQQLARIHFLSKERTLKRKIKEIILAIIIEKRLSKLEILDLYLNKIYLGNRSYGIEAAARNYFRKSAKNLTIGEAAVLAGIPKSPARYAPHRNRSHALKRQSWVLKQMLREKTISAKAALSARNEQLKFYNHAEDHWSTAPYFVEAVKKELAKKLEFQALSTSGLKIKTTLDGTLQKAIQKAISSRIKHLNLSRDVANDQLNADIVALSNLSQKKPSQKTRPNHDSQRHSTTYLDKFDQIQGAVVSLDSKSGAILAMQGGEDFGSSQFNRSIFIKRPIGNLVIPFYIATAIEQGLTPISSVDEDLGTRIARDLDGNGISRAPIKADTTPMVSLTLYDLLLTGDLSHITPLAANIGQGTITKKLLQLGFETKENNAPMVDRQRTYSANSSPLEVAKAFSTFANNGKLLQHYLIESVETPKGEILYQAPKSKRLASIFSKDASLVTRQLLTLTRSAGYASPIKLPNSRDTVIEGASPDLKDSWAIHISDQIVQVIWIGAEKGSRALAKSQLQVREQSIGFMQTLLSGIPMKFKEAQRVPSQKTDRDLLGPNWFLADLKRQGQKSLRIPMLRSRVAAEERENLSKAAQKGRPSGYF